MANGSKTGGGGELDYIKRLMNIGHNLSIDCFFM